eukprot:Phypoly_transcript_20047.p1 GENE.Phypoly_transcript_20047~~Phypoly_transcript_20047.p1  ORF type:complete len:153 (+),score=23.44 Phypoly_transcript_20047:107-565(+)
MHYLVAVDHSEGSAKALEQTIKMLNVSRGDKITAVHAITVGVSTLVQAAALVDPLTGDLVEAQEVDRTENMQFAAQAKAQTAAVCKKADVAYDYVEGYGTAIEVIKDTVDKVHPDILVLGSRSLNVVQRLFLGSVSTHFVQHAPCPVLVVPS